MTNDQPDMCRFLRGLFPPEYGRRLILMLQAFVDASKPKDGSVVSVAGFVGIGSEWSKFQRAWRRKRKELQLEYFHMTDFMSGQAKPYKDWTEDRRQGVMTRLIQLINLHLWFGVAVAANVADFTALRDEKRILCGKNIYALCAAQCIGIVSRALVEEKIDEPVAWVFEAGDKGEPEFTSAMGHLCATKESARRALQVFTIAPGSKKDIAPLDAADFLAWESVQHLPEPVGDKLILKESKPYIKRLTLDLPSLYMYRGNIGSWSSQLTTKQTAVIPAMFRIELMCIFDLLR